MVWIFFTVPWRNSLSRPHWVPSSASYPVLSFSLARHSGLSSIPFTTCRSELCASWCVLVFSGRYSVHQR